MKLIIAENPLIAKAIISMVHDKTNCIVTYIENAQKVVLNNNVTVVAVAIISDNCMIWKDKLESSQPIKTLDLGLIEKWLIQLNHFYNENDINNNSNYFEKSNQFNKINFKRNSNIRKECKLI